MRLFHWLFQLIEDNGVIICVVLFVLRQGSWSSGVHNYAFSGGSKFVYMRTSAGVAAHNLLNGTLVWSMNIHELGGIDGFSDPSIIISQGKLIVTGKAGVAALSPISFDNFPICFLKLVKSTF